MYANFNANDTFSNSTLAGIKDRTDLVCLWDAIWNWNFRRPIRLFNPDIWQGPSAYREKITFCISTPDGKQHSFEIRLDRWPHDCHKGGLLFRNRRLWRVQPSVFLGLADLGVTAIRRQTRLFQLFGQRVVFIRSSAVLSTRHRIFTVSCAVNMLPLAVDLSK